MKIRETGQSNIFSIIKERRLISLSMFDTCKRNQSYRFDLRDKKQVNDIGRGDLKNVANNM